MKIKYPKYSILMSVYSKDNPKWLIESIDSMLAQTLKADEFVIVLDGAIPTELENILSQYKKKDPKLFKIVRLKKNVGLGLALATGVKVCSNEFIARMDADDYSSPERVEKQFEMFIKNPELGLVGTNVNEFTQDIKQPTCYVKLPEDQIEIIKFAKKRCPFRHPSLLYKRSTILEVGNYRNFPLYEDYDLYTRLLQSGIKCYNIQKPLTFMRINPNFYKRRGGIHYAKKTLKFKNHQLRTGFYNLPDYLITTFPHLAVCVMPNFIRKKIYHIFLRDGVTND